MHCEKQVRNLPLHSTRQSQIGLTIGTHHKNQQVTQCRANKHSLRLSKNYSAGLVVGVDPVTHKDVHEKLFATTRLFYSISNDLGHKSKDPID